MEIGLFALLSLFGLAFLFEGYRRGNPVMIVTASLLLMVTTTDIYLNGLSYPSGAVLNETGNGITTITYTYSTKTDWYVDMLSKILFSLGFISLVWFPFDYYSKARGEYTGGGE